MKTKKIILNKQTVVDLDCKELSSLKAGLQLDKWGKCNATNGCGRFTGGCTDGCGTLFNCTDGHCTQDCTGGLGTTTEKETESGTH